MAERTIRTNIGEVLQGLGSRITKDNKGQILFEKNNPEVWGLLNEIAGGNGDTKAMDLVTNYIGLEENQRRLNGKPELTRINSDACLHTLDRLNDEAFGRTDLTWANQVVEEKFVSDSGDKGKQIYWNNLRENGRNPEVVRPLRVLMYLIQVHDEFEGNLV